MDYQIYDYSSGLIACLSHMLIALLLKHAYTRLVRSKHSLDAILRTMRVKKIWIVFSMHRIEQLVAYCFFKLLNGTVYCMLYIFVKVYCNFGWFLFVFRQFIHMVYALIIRVRRLVGICIYNTIQYNTIQYNIFISIRMGPRGACIYNEKQYC